MTTHYHGSKGPVPIADMAYPHLKAAHAKLQREGDSQRSHEISAMGAELARRDEEYAREQAAK